MIVQTLPSIKSIIFDMDGVLWRDDTPLADLPAVFSVIRAAKLKYVFATNNSTKSVKMYVQKLQAFHVPVEPWQIVNSTLATARLLKERYPSGGPVFIIGEKGLHETLSESGFFHARENVLAVVAGLDRHLTYDALSQATLLIRKGVPFIGTNPDKTFPSPQGLVPGAGTVLAALEAASDVKPEIVGKPGPELFRLSLERLETLPEQTLVIGDRLDTDILGGHRSGCRTALVLTGVSTREEAERFSPPPDIVVPGISDLFLL